MQLTARFQAIPRLAPVLLLIALIVLMAAAIVIVGSRRELPPPFGPAANGRLAYVSNGQIYSAEPDGSDPRQLTFGNTGAATPVWSHDGTRFTFKRLSANEPADDPTLYGDLIVARADGSNPITIDAGLTGLSPGLWSPDDRYVLFSRVTDPDREQVFVAAADGSTPPKRVGDPATWNWGPMWSPDATKISYISGNAVYVMDRDGSNIKRLSRRYTEMSGAEWSPNGAQLLFSAGPQGNHDLWLVSLDGRLERAIADDPASEDSHAFSPDGSSIAFLRAASPGSIAKVVVVRTDGSDERTMPGTYTWLGPVWSPDGTTLVVGDDRQYPTRYSALDPDGSANPRALDLPALGPTSSPDASGVPAWRPDFAEIPAWQRRAP